MATRHQSCHCKPNNLRLPTTLLRLAFRAEEGRTLRLHDSLNDAAVAGTAQFPGAIVNSVLVLVAPGLIQGVPVRPVRQRRTLVLDRIEQYIERRLMDVLPLGDRQLVAANCRMKRAMLSISEAYRLPIPAIAC